MSGINRLLSRKDRQSHVFKREKVKSPALASERILTIAFSSHHSPSRRQSFCSFSSFSLAFANISPKRSPRLEVTNGTVECSSADWESMLLQPKQSVDLLNGLFVDDEKRKSANKEDETKVKAIGQRLTHRGIANFSEADIAYTLSTEYAKGDSEKAYELLVLLEESEAGIVRPFQPDIKLLGAVNRQGVTCYLDALLFAMFARLGSFEAMLYKNFEDPPRKHLATLLRLWVNTLRAGKLITTDITKQIQLQLANCGWKDAAELCQQDASEAFTVITSSLALPLLTLKMDIFHTGKEDVSDDHKFINERLLELAIPDDPADGHPVTLEECLEMFFNNKIEVKRYLDLLERRNTLRSIRSRRSEDSTKAHASHIEIAEIADISQPSSPMPLDPQANAVPISPVRPTFQRQRAPSIIQEHYVSEKGEKSDYVPSTDEKGPLPGRVRKEVMMPAWQFFSLIPWYTNNVPSNDAQVAAHFSSTHPILGICLKRYSMLPNGTAVKRKTHVDIPLEIGLPHFIQDDRNVEDGPAFGNFKLSLQSVVCHQGISVHSGHYISLVRSPHPNQEGDDRWMRFDDLATERVTFTNAEQFLREEAPYLLFYQVVPIEGDADHIRDSEVPLHAGERPPAYSETDVGKDHRLESSPAGFPTGTDTSNSTIGDSTIDTSRPSLDVHRPSTSSLESISENGRRGRPSMTSDRRPSVVASDISTGSLPKIDIAVAPNSDFSQSDGPNALTASRGGSRPVNVRSKSSDYGRSEDKRISTSLSRLASRMSRDKLNSASVLAKSPGSRDGSSDVAPVFKDAATQKSKPNISVLPENEKPVDKSKSKKLLRDHQHLIKGRKKENKPDRECSVM